jgi:deoxyadenosine/deoxycytidine kinase
MIEGNIGAGKSTFLKILQGNLDAEIIFEPTNKWQSDDDDNNLLHLFYKDTPRWAYTFQSYAFISRVQTILQHQTQPKGAVQFLERSIYCDRFCFAKTCYEAGLMSALEWHIYKEWFAWLSEKHTPLPSGFIYLKTDPEVCFKRVLKRHRQEEGSISIDYLKSLHQRHEEWLVHQKGIMPHLKNIPILVLDCNQEFETDTNTQKQHINRIKEFLIQKITYPHTPHKNLSPGQHCNM